MPNMNDVKKTIEAALDKRAKEEQEGNARGGYVNPVSPPYTVDGRHIVPSLFTIPESVSRDNMTKEEMDPLLASARSQATQIIQACNDLVDLSNALLDSLVEIENEVGHLYDQTL